MPDSSFSPPLASPVLPVAAFVDPHGANREAVEHLAQQVLDLVLEYASTAAARPPLPNRAKDLDYDQLFEAPASEQDLIDRLTDLMAGAANLGHPGYIGHMDPAPTTASMLGALVTAALNNNMLLLELSPTLSRLEHRLMEQLAQRFGLGEAAGGMMASGGTLANLQALAVARNAAFEAVHHGIVQLDRQPVVLASEAAHISIRKAAMLLGLGADAVLSVPTNADAQMDVNALQEIIAQANASGHHPFCLVATAGTTVTGNIDPLDDIAQIAHAHGLWYHVDAAYGGALIFSSQQRHRLRGIEHADSVTFNPQKWMHVARTSAMVLVRDVAVLDRAFRLRAAYAADTDAFTDLGEISVQGTRHADVLKLWLSLLHLGPGGYARLIDASYDRTARFVEHIRQRPFLELATTPETNLVCFRAVPAPLSVDRQDAWNARLHAFLRERGVFLSLPAFRGHRWLRAVLLNPYTDETTLDRLFDAIDAFVQQHNL